MNPADLEIDSTSGMSKFITLQQRSRINHRELARLEQHQLDIHIQLDRVKEEIVNIKLIQKIEDPDLLQHQLPQPTATVFKRDNFVQITNNLQEEFGTFCKVISNSNNCYSVDLQGCYRTTRY